MEARSRVLAIGSMVEVCQKVCENLRNAGQ